MELSTFEITDEMLGTLNVKNPNTGEELEGVTITFMGTESPRYREIAKERTAKRRFDAARRAIPSDEFSMKQSLKDIEEMEGSMIDTVAIAIVNWTGISVDGKEVPFSLENAITVLKRFPWLFAQCNQFLSNRTNFKLASS